MTGQVAAAQPLRSTDPRQLGPCELLGRLGEGGMGTVYLGRLSATGRMVAVKMIRPDLAHDPEFRRRFRGEVKRARQVPPFCTAEVLDADPDHEPPYLIAEYVDGPSLASVVTERGPLTSGNLHGLAVGMATALTAIHGAGVIHRDLKPSNVLLPPGSPKVIDFGIARAVAGTGVDTRTGQVIGTVAYMAPERFESAGKGVLTPAADVFAWGAVVGYAGTGRTPFAAETPAATAVRILTREPDLDGLPGPLRELVELALDKDPARRPTARELLDRLLGTGLARSGPLASALAGQPGLLKAAEQAQAVTVPRPLAETALATGGESDDLGRATIRQGGPGPGAVVAGSGAAARPERREPGRGRRRTTTVLLVLVALLGAGVGVGYASGFLPYQASSTVTPSTGTSSLPAGGAGAPSIGGPSGASPTVSAGQPDGTPWTGTVVLSDPLTAAGQWEPRAQASEQVVCGFDEALVVTKRSQGPYRCPGARANWLDVRVEVEVTLVAPGSCAAIWIRFTDQAGGSALRICPDGYYLVEHGLSRSTSAGTFRFAAGSRLTSGTPIRVGIVARGEELRFYRDGQRIGQAWDANPVAGRVVLGIFSGGGSAKPPYKVAFRAITIETPT